MHKLRTYTQRNVLGILKIQGVRKRSMYTAKSCYNIRTTNDKVMKIRPIDRNYFELKFPPSLSFERTTECGKNVNLRLGQYCRCTQDGTSRTWSAKVRNRINVLGFIIQKMLNWLFFLNVGFKSAIVSIRKIMKKWNEVSVIEDQIIRRSGRSKAAQTNENIALLEAAHHPCAAKGGP